MARRRQILADLALLLLALVWGSTFVLVKDSVTLVGPFTLLALRFLVALISLLPFAVVRWRGSRRDLCAGALIGVWLFSGYAFQTVGLQYTLAGISAFITGLSVVIVPFLALPLLRQRPTLGAGIGIVLATVGLGLLSLRSDLSLGYGDLLTVACAFSFALHITFVSKYAPAGDPLLLTTSQVAVAAAASLVAAGSSEWIPVPFPTAVTLAAIFLGLVATAFAFLVQVSVQRFTSATHTALIFTMEPVFGALFAYLLAGEVLNERGVVGCALILAGMIAAELA